MNIAFYSSHSTFEFLPTLSLTCCTSEKLLRRVYTLILAWGTLNLEISGEHRIILNKH